MRASRRKFLKLGSLFVPATFGIIKARAVESLRDPAFLSRLHQKKVTGNGLLTGLSAYWKLDEAMPGPFADSTGNGNSLTLVTDGNMSSVTGVIIKGVQSIGGGGQRYLWIADNAFVSAGSGLNFSVQVWASNNSPAYAGATFISKCDDIHTVPAGNGEYRLYSDTANSGQLRWQLWQSNGTAVDLGLSGIGTGGFHHYVVTFNASTNTAKCYSDGVLKNTVVLNSNVLRTTFPFNLLDENKSFNNAGGIVDEAAIWHAELTQTQITSLFASGAGFPFSSFS